MNTATSDLFLKLLDTFFDLAHIRWSSLSQRSWDREVWQLRNATVFQFYETLAARLRQTLMSHLKP